MESVEKQVIAESPTYSAELLPKTGADKNWGVFNYVTLWMGAVHNILSYMTVAGFFLLGLNTKQVLSAVMLSAVIVSIFYVLNGVASAKYGLPFPMLLRSVFGVKGAIIPSLCRGLIAGVVFFGTQSVVSAQSLDVLFSRIFPSYMTIGGGMTIFGMPAPTMLSYLLVWCVTVVLFLGGTKVLDKFGNWSSPIVYVFIIGAAVWTIQIAGGFGPILDYSPVNATTSPLVFIACVSALVSNWAGPIVNIGDFTQKAKTPKAMMIGLPLGFILSYILFAITCVGLIAGTQIAFGEPIFNIVNAFDKIDNTFAVFVLILALNMGALAFVVFGNLFPAGLQMSSLFPKFLDVKKAGVLTAIIGTMILPWKLVENASTLFYFYSFIGSMFGPIAGIMLASFYIEHKQVIDLDDIYVEDGNLGEFKSGYNKTAMITLATSFVITMSGAFLQSIPFLKTINDFAFFSGLIFSFVVYSILSKVMKGEKS
ncbi:cytosine permease [Enterococcus ureasiticus]|uniref:Allantoin transporter n=1 Tax=Enterococcus ureasiticus TaxID=903984 RepID=A0A1E5G7C9_9ENTE|nr:cytosine permease [Enterococcus ureasiticus]OEG08608.1 allantoin transporter [Enterococcus ureasiticus]